MAKFLFIFYSDFASLCVSQAYIPSDKIKTLIAKANDAMYTQRFQTKRKTN